MSPGTVSMVTEPGSTSNAELKARCTLANTSCMMDVSPCGPNAGDSLRGQASGDDRRTTIDDERLSVDTRSGRRAQKLRAQRQLFRGHQAPVRRALRHFGEARRAARNSPPRLRRHRSRRERIRSDSARGEFHGEVSDQGLERALGRTNGRVLRQSARGAEGTDGENTARAAVELT